MKDDLTFSTPELAALVGCSGRHLQQLAADGIIPKPERGRWPQATVAAYCEYLRSDARRGPADFAAERARLTRARASVAELELEQRRGELLARADVDAAMIGAFGRVRARLLTVPSRVAAEVAAVGDPPGCEVIVRAAIYDVLSDLAATTPEALVEGV